MYDVVIGLEVHCALNTNSKNFTNSKNTYSTSPNINVSVVDLGLPGILPVPNKEAIRKAIKTAMALKCDIPNEVLFDRKNYYYPDLPKGYQITQVTKPFGKNGKLNCYVGETKKEVLIHQLHLEEDTASLEHFGDYSLIDYNRSGVPLIEIVTEPCIYSADEAIAFLEYLRNIFLYCEVSEARSDKGQMRCDVNISLKTPGSTELGTKVEIKNINSFVAVRAAIEYEIKRQTELLNKGEKIIQETRRIDENGITHSMREKVDAIDYKYFIEPNIPPVKLSEEYLTSVKQEVPELQFDKINRLLNNDLNFKEANTLARDKSLSNYYDEVYKLVDAKDTVKNWVINYVVGLLNKKELLITNYNITPQMLANVINLVNQKELNQLHAKEILEECNDNNTDPIRVIEEKGLKQVSNEEDLLKLVKEVIEENPKQVEEYLSGRDLIANFFVGMIMKKTNKQANPETSLKLIKEELEKKK